MGSRPRPKELTDEYLGADSLSWNADLYALLSLTLVRMVSVGLAMIGSRARRPTVAFLGWFGPVASHRSCSP